LSDLIYIGTRLDYDTKGLVEKLCEARGVSVADLLRSLVRRELAVHNYLGDDTRKAFGVEKQ
jgi:hypothetical protein